MSETALIIINDRVPSLSEVVNFAIEAALESSASVVRVRDAAEQSVAVAAQSKLAEVQRAIQKAAKEARNPAIEEQRAIIRFEEKILAPLYEELNRVSKLVGEYVVKQRDIQREQERIAKLAADKLAMEQAAALAKAKTVEQVKRVNETFTDRAATEIPAPRPIEVAKGQVVREDIEIEVFDIWALVRDHPNLVRVEPRLADIKDAVRAGRTISGVRAKNVIKSTVSTGRQRPAIDV